MMNNSKSQIKLTSFNPYEAVYPQRRVISREMLELMKVLRGAGYSVIVEPENGHELCYLARKDLHDFLSDPVSLFLIGLPVSVVTGLISNWIYTRLQRPTEKDEVHIILECDENGKSVRYDHRGREISDKRFSELLESMNRNRQANLFSPSISTPEKERPIPINLDHTGKIVGWAKQILIDESGMRIQGVKITDPETLEKIESGELKGWSIGGLIRKATCTVCQSDYLSCFHIAGEVYNSTTCSVHIDAIDIAEISLVKFPAQPLAFIQIEG